MYIISIHSITQFLSVVVILNSDPSNHVAPQTLVTPFLSPHSVSYHSHHISSAFKAYFSPWFCDIFFLSLLTSHSSPFFVGHNTWWADVILTCEMCTWGPTPFMTKRNGRLWFSIPACRSPTVTIYPPNMALMLQYLPLCRISTYYTCKFSFLVTFDTIHSDRQHRICCGKQLSSPFAYVHQFMWAFSCSFPNFLHQNRAQRTPEGRQFYLNLIWVEIPNTSQLSS